MQPEKAGSKSNMNGGGDIKGAYAEPEATMIPGGGHGRSSKLKTLVESSAIVDSSPGANDLVIGP